MRNPGRNPKSEGRSPKEGRNPKSEPIQVSRFQVRLLLTLSCRKLKRIMGTFLLIRAIRAIRGQNQRALVSDFGLRPSFGFRVSGFGLPLLAPS